jgi:biotin carboxyl carrier protein
VMATPYSQIVGAQAIENILSGKRYEQFTDEAIKYVMGLYGEPVVPVDPNVMDRIMSLPRAKEFINWKPAGYEKPVEEIRREIGPDLSDDDLLLKLLIPGKPVKRAEGKKPSAPAPKKAKAAITAPVDFPTEFAVEVDGEVFNVKISPKWDGAGGALGSVEAEKAEGPKKLKEVPPGAVLCNMAGLILSIEAKVGDHLREGDLVAIIEAMKMRRHVNSPRNGVVKEICAHEGDMVAPEDILMVVE